MADYDPRLDEPRDPQEIREKHETSGVGIMGAVIGIFLLVIAALLFFSTGANEPGTQVGENVEKTMPPVTRP